MAKGDMFLKLDGIKGESMDDKHKDEIEISSLSWGASQSGSGGSMGGSGVGKVNLADIHITKTVDKASTSLFQKCCQGTHITKGTITIRRSGEKPQDYETIDLTEVFISSWSQSAADGSGLPTESVSLNFSKIEFDYKAQKADGTLDASTKKGWDVKVNKIT